ncbi:MAG TPA: WD40 repeat domain-containing protein, partial [Gemmataceae bacterium]|nr:WD40 repeat domain-containing protein [Gemmataceae bacterium]
TASWDAPFFACSLAFSPDGKTLASGCGGNKVHLWDVATGKNRALLELDHEFANPLVAFSPNGKMLVSGGACIADMNVWDAASGKNVAVLKGYDLYGSRAVFFSPDGKTLATVGYHDGVKLWDLKTSKNTATFKLGEYTPAAAFSPDGRVLAVGGADKTVQLWDVGGTTGVDW